MPADGMFAACSRGVRHVPVSGSSKTKLHYFTAGGRGELPVLALPMLSILLNSASNNGPGLTLPAGCCD